MRAQKPIYMPYVIFTVIVLVDLVVFLRAIPESKNRPLPEMMPDEFTLRTCCKSKKQHGDEVEDH